MPKEGAVVANVYLPADTNVRMAIYAIHRDPRYYKVSNKDLIEAAVRSRLETYSIQMSTRLVDG